MFILAHVGITLGVAILASAGISHYHHPAKSPDTGLSQTAPINTPSPGRKSILEIIGFTSLARFLDVRLLILGSMLPDIIDKPLGSFILGDGRSITHTLLITLIMVLIALFLYINYKKTWGLAISLGMVSHLILDSMWLTPQILFWPLYGWGFPNPDFRSGFHMISLWWSTLFNNSTVDITEGIGLVILLIVAWLLVSQRKLICFLIKGKI